MGGRYSDLGTYLCTYNANFTDTELGVELARFRSGVKVFVIVDACFSGGLFKDGKPVEWPFAENAMNAYQGAMATKLGVSKEALPKQLTSYMGFITACDFYQTCSAGNPYSLFNKYVLQSFTARALADNSPVNGLLSFWEAYKYANPRAASENPYQTAQYYNYSLLRANTLAAFQRLGIPTPIGPTGSTIANPLFSWTVVSGAHHYRLLVYNSSGSLVIDRNNITATSWRPTTGLLNGSYRWRVAAYNVANITSGWSAYLNFTVNPSGAFIRRATLTWGAAPRDLDSHLLTPTGAYHIYYPSSSRGSQTALPYAELDVDDTNGVGPENISIYRYLVVGTAVYKYYVHNYSNERNLAGCGALVSVQSSSGPITSFTCPTTGGTGRYWHVFNMSSAGAITRVNRILPSAPSP